METYEVEQEKAFRSAKEEVSTSDEPSGNQALVIDSEWGGASGHYAADTARLEKKQEFKRNFNLISTLGFVSIYTATWEIVLLSLSEGFINGGFGGLFWTFIGTVLCCSTIVASLAEMESMAPTSGGQYHWVSKFAPPKYQKFLSYSTGWMSTLAWVASMTSGSFLVTTLIEAAVEVSNADFAFTNWQYTLIVIAFTSVTIVFNTWRAGILPLLETISLLLHIGGWLITLISLWVLCPRNPASDVFAQVVNSGGWDNVGTACLISQVTVIYCILGSDSIVHISEEVENASIVVPRAMWWSYVLNAILGFIILITMLFGIGNLEDVLDSDAPYLFLFRNTGSNGVALMLIIILFLLIYSGNITTLVTVSRELWAFSRDRGFPCSGWISHMNLKYEIPFNAVYLSSVGTAILCLINLGSTLAFNIIVSLSLLAFMSTYMMSIGCVLLNRIKGEKLPPARWSLGRFALPINAFAFLYAGFIIVFSCFPVSVPVAIGNANWAPAVWAGVIVLSLIIYVTHGKKHYTPPVLFVEGRKAAGVGLQATH